MIKLAIALLFAGSPLVAEDAIFGTDGEYRGFARDVGDRLSVWDAGGNYKGFILKRDEPTKSEALGEE